MVAGFLVRSHSGKPLPNVVVTVEVIAGGGQVDQTSVTTGSDGVGSLQWLLGSQPIQELRGTVSNTLLQARLQVAVRSGRLGPLVPLQGSVRGLRGNVVENLPAVQVVDTGGRPLPGVTVTFRPAAGAGVVFDGTVLSDSLGIARPVAWRLGPAAGAQHLNVQAEDQSAVLTALAAEPPDRNLRIAVRFLGPYSEAESVATFAAKERWERLLHSDLPDVTVAGPPPDACGVSAGEPIDDVLIGVQFREESDDPFDGLVGEASLCLVRAESGMPAAGVVTIYRGRIARGGFELGDVLLHEFGHVLGITPELQFAGERSRQAYLLAGGTPPSECAAGSTSRSCRGFPPVDQVGAHWDEAVFKNELMTPIAYRGAEPLSTVTIAALGDVGYLADEAAADPFGLPVSLPAPGASPAQGPRDRIVPGPAARIRRDGRIIR